MVYFMLPIAMCTIILIMIIQTKHILISFLMLILQILLIRDNFFIKVFQIYGGWLYYQERVPVEQEWGYDTYAGAINRLHLDGTNWQQLTEERVGYDWYVDVNGLHFDYPFKDESNVLSFNEMN